MKSVHLLVMAAGLVGGGCASAHRAAAPAELSVAWPESQSVDFQLTDVSLTNSLDLRRNTHRAELLVGGTVKVQRMSPAIGVDVVPVIESCIMDDGTDITRLHESNEAGPDGSIFSPSTRRRVPRWLDKDERISWRFPNIPPRAYESIREMRGYFQVAHPRRVESALVPCASGAKGASESGWEVEVQSVADRGAGQRSPGRVRISRRGTEVPGVLDPPRLVRIEIMDEWGKTIATVPTTTASTGPGGIIVEWNDVQASGPRGTEVPPFATIRVEFVAEFSREAVRFDYRDVVLRR